MAALLPSRGGACRLHRMKCTNGSIGCATGGAQMKHMARRRKSLSQNGYRTDLYDSPYYPEDPDSSYTDLAIVVIIMIRGRFFSECCLVFLRKASASNRGPPDC